MEEKLITATVAVIYMLVESVKWLIKRSASTEKQEQRTIYETKSMEKLSTIERTLLSEEQKHMQTMMALKDITSSLAAVSRSQTELGRILEKLHDRMD